MVGLPLLPVSPHGPGKLLFLTQTPDGPGNPILGFVLHLFPRPRVDGERTRLTTWSACCIRVKVGGAPSVFTFSRLVIYPVKLYLQSQFVPRKMGTVVPVSIFL